MHVVFPIMRLSKSGGIRVLVELANGLASRGHQITVLVARPSDEESFPLNARVAIRRSNRRSVLGDLWWLGRNFPRDADTVVANFYLTAFPTVMVTRLRGLLGFYLIQGFEPVLFATGSSRRLPALQRALARISYRLPLNQITVSAWLQSILHNATGKTIVVIQDGVDTAIFRPSQSSQEPGDIHTIMVLGRREPHKGFGVFLEAIGILSAQRPDFRLLVVTQDRDLTVDLPVPLEYAYPASDRELADLYRRANVFVFPSSQPEGFGLPPLEAMACGTPVVTTACGGVLDYALDGHNCLVVPMKDAIALAEAIGRILDDPELATQLSMAGRETAEGLTYDIMVGRFERLLDAHVQDLHQKR